MSSIEFITNYEQHKTNTAHGASSITQQQCQGSLLLPDLTNSNVKSLITEENNASHIGVENRRKFRTRVYYNSNYILRNQRYVTHGHNQRHQPNNYYNHTSARVYNHSNPSGEKSISVSSNSRVSQSEHSYSATAPIGRKLNIVCYKCQRFNRFTYACPMQRIFPKMTRHTNHD